MAACRVGDTNIGSQVFVDSQPSSVPRCAPPQVLVNVDLAGAIDQRFFQNEVGDAPLNGAIWQTAANLELGSRFPAQTRPMAPTTSAAFRRRRHPHGRHRLAPTIPTGDTLADTADKAQRRDAGRCRPRPGDVAENGRQPASVVAEGQYAAEQPPAAIAARSASDVAESVVVAAVAAGCDVEAPAAPPAAVAGAEKTAIVAVEQCVAPPATRSRH